MSPKRIVLVASVSIMREDEVLVIRESTSTVLDKWNFPSGRMEYGEDILNSAKREVKEETGLDVKLVSSTGVYNFVSSTNDQVILFHFIGEAIGGSLKLEEEKILESKWVKLNELAQVEIEDFREPMVIRQIIENLLNENTLPITMYNEQLVEI